MADHTDIFELQALESRVLLSAASGAWSLENPLAGNLLSSAIVETATESTATTATPEAATNDWFPTVALSEVTAPTDTAAAASTETTTVTETVSPAPASSTPATPTAITPGVEPAVTSPTLSVATLPNGPPVARASALTSTTNASGPSMAAGTYDLADTFSTGLAGLDAALTTWGAYFNLSSIDWAGQGLTAVSLPVLPDQLNALFDLNTTLDAATLPSFTAATDVDSFVSLLNADGFSITAISGGYTNGSTTIAATTGSSLLEGTYTLTLGTGLGKAAGFSGDTFNDATPGVLSGLASGASLDGSITWSGDLSLHFGFVLDATQGLLLTGDSALDLTVSGSGTLAGSGTAAGAATTFSGTANASLTVALGFHDAATNYAVSDFTAENIAAVASGTAALSLSFTAGPASLTFGGAYTLTADLTTRAVTQALTLTLTGQLTLPGVTQSDGTTAATIDLTGSYDSGTATWTLAGSASGLKLLGQDITSLTASTTLGAGSFSGSFAGSLQTDFLSSGSSPVVVDLSATFDRSQVTVTGTVSVDTLSFGGTDGATLFTATGVTASASFTGDIDAGTLTGSLALSATSATFLPDSTTFTAKVSDSASDGDNLAFSGSYDFSTQQLAITLDQLDVTMPDVLTVSVAGLAVTYDRKNSDPTQTIATAATVTIQLVALQEAGSDPPTATVSNLTIRQNGFAFDSASLTLGDHTIGGILTVGSLAVTLSNVDYTVGETPTGTLGLTAATATLFPGGAATATVTGISGQFDVATKAFSLTLDSVDATIGSLLTFTATGVDFGYDPTGPPSQTVFSVDTLTATVPSSSLTGTLTGLEVTAAGDFSAVSLSLDTSSVASSLGIGELLPFNIDSITAVFAGDTNGNGVRDSGEVFLLTAFDLTVTGSFDFSKMGALPFTPILQIGDTSIADGSNNTFTFTISVDSSGVRPKDIGPITIGFSDLKIGDTVTLGGSITLGGYQDGVFNPDFSGTLQLQTGGEMSNVSGSASVTISGTFTGGVLNLTGNFAVSFTYGSYVSVTDANLGFEMTVSAGSGFDLSLDHLALTSGSIGSITLSFGSLMTLSATSAIFDFTATGSAAVATFGSMSVTFPGLGDLSGTATNFGFAADGSLITLDGFGVAISATSAALKWPDWLPITITQLSIKWADFASDPTDFTIILSASVNSLNGLSALSVSGTIEGVVIDIGLLKEGKFPITDFDAISVSVSGSAFGGTVSGSLVIGILKLDASGNIVTSFDDTAVAQRILYGAVAASFEFGGTSGFEIRIGVSELGPLQIYLSVSAPVILEPISGLAITDFRAGVTFNSTLPDITDPFALDDPAFTPASQLTADEWLAQLQTAVANQAANSSGGSFWSVFSQPMVIQGGATLYSAYASTSTFRADIDIMFDTEGRVVVNARGTFADSFSMNFRLYANLTEIQTSGTFLFLARQPDNPALITYYGALQFKFLAADGSAASSASQAASFYLSISGGAIAELESVGSITLDATVTLTISATKTQIDFSGSLNMSGLGNAITTAGTFVIDTSGSTTKLYGVAQLDVTFDQLEDKGLYASGTALLEINTTGTAITTSITLPGGTPTSYTLAPQTFAAVVTGSVQVKEAGSDLFYMEGTFIFSLNAAGLDLLVDGQVLIGDKTNPTATLSTQSYFAIRSAGVAAKIDLTLVGSFSGGDIAVDATFQLIFNTTSQDVTYTLPSGVTLSDGSTSVTVSGTSPAGKQETYLYLDIRGSLTVAGAFALTDGQFTLTVTPSLLSLEVAATFTLKAGSTSLLTFGVSGGIQIASDGVAAVLTLSLQTNAPSSQGWSIDGTASMQFNTRASTVTIAGVAVAKDTVQVALSGTFTVGDFTMSGAFAFTVSGSTVTVTADASLPIKIGSTQILNLDVSGGLSINSSGLAAVIDVSLSTGPSSSAGWSLSADFLLELNTRSSAVTISGTKVAAKTLQLYIDGSLTASGFSFAGTFLLTVDSSSVTIAATAAITVAGVSLNVTGNFGVYSDGLAFSLSLSASQLKTSLITVQGTFTIAVNTTSSTRFGIAKKSGYVSVTGVKITLAGFTISGSITISSDGTITVPSSDPLTLSVLGQTASFYGWVDLSDGTFDLNAAITISFGSKSVAQIAGTLNLELFYTKTTSRNSTTITSGLNGTFSANLYAFNLTIASLSGTTSISSDGSFDLSVSASFTLSSFVSITSTVEISVDSGRHVALEFSGTFDIFGKFKASIGGYANSQTGQWGLWGNSSASFGNSNLGSSVGVSVVLGNGTVSIPVTIGGRTYTQQASPGITISGSAWAGVKVLGVSFGISGSFSASLTSESASVGISGSARAGFIKVKASVTVHMDFKTGKVWLSDIGGAFVFFDANLNGVFDPGEPSTTTDSSGNFTFDTPVTNLPDTSPAGTVLAGLDIDGDGRLTANEGKFLLTGGTSLSTGKTNKSTVTLTEGALSGASDYAGATAFFDQNLNGKLDKNEVSVTTAADGSYTFLDALLPENSINHLGRLEGYDTNHNGVIDPSEGVLVLTGGVSTVDGTANPGSELLGSPEGHTIYAGATIFLDLNGNGTLDANEVSTVAAADGAYQFDSHVDALEASVLGDLAAFDLNGNGVIDAAEGVLKVTGGRLIAAIPDAGLAAGDAFAGVALLPTTAVTGVAPMADATIFLDVNGNGKLDAGEPAVTTNDHGAYSFSPNARAAVDAALGALAPFDTNGNGEIDPSEGQLVRLGGTVIGGQALDASDLAEMALFENNAASGVVKWTGATVFLDVNGNGKLDAGEVSTTSSDTGFYTFLATSDFGTDLGALAAYDTNGNGVLDPSEGVFVIQGGTDLNSGLTNERTLTVLAINYGSVFSTELSPLSELYTYLVLGGMSLEDANATLVTAFGLPPTTNILTFDPTLESASDAAESSAKLISIYADASADVILALAAQQGVTAVNGRTLDHGYAEDFLIQAVATMLAKSHLTTVPLTTDADGNLVASPATIALHDESLIQSALASAITAAGLKLPSDAALAAAAGALHHIGDRVVELQHAGLSNLTRALARVNAYVHDVFRPALTALFATPGDAAAFTAEFTESAIHAGIRSIDLPGADVPPTVTGVTDTTHDDRSLVPATLTFNVSTTDGLPDEIHVTASSDNAFLLPAGTLVVSGDGADRTLAIDFAPGRWGTATITLFVDDGHGGADGTTTVTLTFTVRYTYAELMQSRLTEQTRHDAEQDDTERRAQQDAALAALLHDLARLRAAAATPDAVITIALSAPPATPLEAQVGLDAAMQPRRLPSL